VSVRLRQSDSGSRECKVHSLSTWEARLGPQCCSPSWAARALCRPFRGGLSGCPSILHVWSISMGRGASGQRLSRWPRWPIFVVQKCVGGHLFWCRQARCLSLPLPTLPHRPGRHVRAASGIQLQSSLVTGSL